MRRLERYLSAAFGGRGAALLFMLLCVVLDTVSKFSDFRRIPLLCLSEEALLYTDVSKFVLGKKLSFVLY